MDTKLKNIKYSNGLKVTAVILICLSFLGITGSAIFFLYYQNNELLTESYYQTYSFEKEFGTLMHNVVELNVVLKDEENIQNSYSEESIPIYLDRLNRIETKLPDVVNFRYYIRNTETNESFTNIDAYDPVKLIKEQNNYVYINQNQSPDKFYYEHDIKMMLKDTPYELYAAVIEPLQSGDIFYNDFTEYTKLKSMFSIVIIVFIICSVIFIGFFIYLIIVTGRKEKAGQIYLRTIDKLYIDVHTLIVFVFATLSIVLAIGITGDLDVVSGIIAFSIILIADILIGLNYILSLTRLIKSRKLLKNTLTFQIYNAIKRLVIMCFSGKIFKPWVVLLLIVYGLIDGFLIHSLFLTYDNFALMILFFIFAAFNIGVIYFVMKALSSLSDIMTLAKETGNGNLDYDFNTSNISVAFVDFADNIKNIQNGIKNAVKEAIKGEQMKTTLITNVSHDLKTPLTSIITYVDLLKKEEIQNKKALEYVKILDDKSLRLKQLIEDLIEASKASTGNLDVKEEEIDLQELILQAYGEFEEKFKDAGLDARIKTDDTKKIIVKADGNHMWRIVENLLVNTIKYSLPESRVYIDIDKADSYGILTIKNVSRSPLDIKPDQLFERFVRGDESRATEGSGLGLAIAKSLTNLQNGKLDIELDGDLFKAIVRIPLVLT